MLGTVVGSYKLTDHLGQGGMGDVYLGEHEIFPRRAAVKCVRSDRIGDARAVERMIREATAASAVDHPSIITVYEVGWLPEGGVYLALEYVEGETLHQRLDRGRMPLSEVATLGRQVCEGLAELHARDVLHRDLKPSNLMIGRKGAVKILDFGLARIQASVELTRDGTVVGTPAFMSPEQVRGEELDGRSDLFSLGAVLFNALTGVLPFGVGTPETLLYRIVHEPHRDLRDLRPETPVFVIETLDRMLSKNRAGRPASAQDLANTFADWERINWNDESAEMELVATETDIWFPTGGPAHAEADSRTIIVHPFENVGASPERAYFGDGLAEALTTALSSRKDVKVVAAAAVRALNRVGTHELQSSALQAAAKLGAGRICMGTARWVGDRVRVTGQLLAAPDGTVLWSEQEDGTEDTFFEIQDRLSHGLTRALKEARTDTSREAGESAAWRSSTHATTERPLEPVPAQALRLFQRGLAFLDDTSGFSVRRAEECLREALVIAPHFHRARSRLALALLKRFLRFERKPEILEEALGEAALAQKGDPDSAMATAVLALGESVRGNYAEGKVKVERAIQLNPNLAFAHLVRAYTAAYTGDLDTTRRAALAAVERDPLDPFILHFSALCVSEVLGEEGRAVEWLRRAVELGPDHFGSLVKLGEMYILVMDCVRAREVYEDALGRMPLAQRELYGSSLPAAWDGLAYAELGLGNYDRARVAAEKSLELGGAEPPVVAEKNLAWARLGLGDIAGARKAGEAAEAQARRYLEINPSDFQYLTGLGEILSSMGRLEEAEEAILAAEKINPNSHFIQDGLVTVRACRGDHRALEMTRININKAPESPGVAYLRYVVLKLLGSPAEAEEAGRQARGLGVNAEGWVPLYERLATMYRGSAPSSLDDLEI